MEMLDRPETASRREQYVNKYADGEFISKFTTQVTSPEFQKWVPILKEKGLDHHYLVGFRIFEELGSFLKEQVSDYAAEDEALRPVQVSPPRAKTVKKKTVNQLSRSPPKPTRSPPNSPPRGQTPQRGEAVSPGAHAVKTTPLRDWHLPGMIRPCPIDGHAGHELSDCVEFFSMSAKDRRSSAKYKVCYTCLSPLWKCREGSRSTFCSQERAFSPLTCRQCTDSVKGRKLSGMNILMCSYKDFVQAVPGQRGGPPPPADRLRQGE